MKRWSLALPALIAMAGVVWAGGASAQERCPAANSGALSGASPKQLGRLKNGSASACGANKAVPNVLNAASGVPYQSYVFRNRSRDPQCVTVSLTSTAGGGIQSSTYLGAYDANNPQTNYLGDAGGNATLSTVSYGVTVPALGDFTVVVSSVTQNAAASYDLAVTGCGAVVVTGVTPNAGPIAGGTGVTIKGSGFLANPSVKFGGSAAGNVVLVDEATITAATPAGAAGPADVLVTNADVTLDALAGGFLYVAPSATAISLSSGKNPSVFGENVLFTAKLTSGVGTPGGTVSFFDGPNKLGDGAIAAGTATLASSALGVGAHPITAQYAGDGTFAAATSLVVDQAVTKASTSTLLVSSKNPSGAAESVTFTATVAAVAPGAGVPSGTVDFSDGGNSIGSVALDGTGKASLSTSALTVGNHNIIATYGGGTNHATSASGSLVQSVGLLSTTTTLASSSNPSLVGEAVTFTATVASASGSPTGSVTFKDGASTIGVGQIAGGKATLQIGTLAAGAHTIVAVYDADATFATSSSAPLTQTVKGLADAGASSSSSSSSSSGGSSSGTSSSSGASGSSSSGGADAGAVPTAAPSTDDGGCGCREAPATGGNLSALALVAAAVAMASRRSRRR